MAAPNLPPSRPREPRPELVAAVARRNQERERKNMIRELETEARKVRERVGPGERLDQVLEQLHVLYQAKEG